MSERVVSCPNGRIVQLIPAPTGARIDLGKESVPVVAYALVELELTDGFADWTGHDIFPVDIDGHLRGLPHDWYYAISAIGDYRGDGERPYVYLLGEETGWRE